MQDDMKKLIAYSSVAIYKLRPLEYLHLRNKVSREVFFKWLAMGWYQPPYFCGVVYIDFIQLISTYGGLVNYLPKYFILIFALAAGLPGTSGFLGIFSPSW